VVQRLTFLKKKIKKIVALKKTIEFFFQNFFMIVETRITSTKKNHQYHVTGDEEKTL